MRLRSTLLLELMISCSMLYLTTTMVLAVSLSKPGCPEKCGNITIPYPFGIGPKCSANSSFVIVCRNSTTPPTPFISSINMEALHISMLGVVIVNQSVFPLKCSTEQRIHNLTQSLVGSPFTISAAHNSLAVLGCKVSAWLRANATTTVGSCTPLCAEGSEDMSCNGVNCCQATIPSRRQELQYTYRSIESYKDNSSCGYVFPVEKKWFQGDYKRHKGLRRGVNSFGQECGFVPLVLEWELEDYRYMKYDNAYSCYQPSHRSDDGNYVCIPSPRNNYHLDDYGPYGSGMYATAYRDGNYICFPIMYYYSTYGAEADDPSIDDDYTSSGHYCYCDRGYEGNPYMTGGCVDINECNNATLNYCSDGNCINTEGSFECAGSGVHINTRVKIALISISGSIGGLVLLVIFILASWKLAKGMRNIIKAHRKYKFYKRNGGLLLEQQLSSTNNNELERTKLFSSKELTQATDHYNENRILGRGGQGTVYKGMLADGKIVAVKKSERVDKDDLEVFINEVVILSQINHRNVVGLLGCCLETEVPLLVYEFVPNGTLFHHLHDPDNEFPLSWEIRVRVAQEIARALCYLHSDASAPIYHRDIKSTNILLDEKYRAKVSDFGTSRSVAIDKTHLTTRVLGTFGYLDPEYFQSSQFTEKSDVYSFGVVMVELLTGEKAITSVRAEEGKSLATHFLHSMEENRLFEILDSRVLKEGDKEDIVVVAELARKCLHLNGRGRPTMKEVVVELEGIHTLKEGSILLQSHDDNMEDVESRDFSSFLGSMPNDTNTTYYSLDDHPLLDEP